MALFTRAFSGRKPTPDQAERLPAGQHLTRRFPVLSAGVTPRTATADWDFTVSGLVGKSLRLDWDQLLALPQETVTVDIHCVTRWSKLDTTWTGVSVDTLMDLADAQADWVTARCDGGYTTNLTREDLTGGKAWIVHTYEGEPLEPQHGGPARLLVPHRYFWKSAKWVRGLRVTATDEPGFWERYGYHDRGDPWREERYQGD